MVRVTCCVLGSAAVLALAACGGDDSESDDAQTETTTQEEESALPEPITASGAEELSLDELLVSELTMEGGPDRLIEAFGSLWLKRDDGVVTRDRSQLGQGDHGHQHRPLQAAGMPGPG